MTMNEEIIKCNIIILIKTIVLLLHKPIQYTNPIISKGIMIMIEGMPRKRTELVSMKTSFSPKILIKVHTISIQNKLLKRRKQNQMNMTRLMKSLLEGNRIRRMSRTRLEKQLKKEGFTRYRF